MKKKTNHAAQFLNHLAGKWSGGGTAMSPTIAHFDYTETLTVVLDEKRPLAHYEQRTYKREEGSNEYVSAHWESGFIRATSDDALEWICSQSGGRVEVLIGLITIQGDAVTVELTSELTTNDPRMSHSTRTIELKHNTLHYVMAMATTEVEQMTMHLDAVLKRA